MERLKRYQKKSFWIITLLMAIVTACVCGGLYWGVDFLLLNFSSDQGQEIFVQKIPQGIAWLTLVLDNFYRWVVPAMAAAFLLIGWGIWLVLGVSLSGVFKQAEEISSRGGESRPAKKDFLDQKIEQERKRRLFLHSLSVLQREGRLLDFFDEDLSLYADDQIGAAVRSIQEDCKRAMKKYIDLRPVLEAQEGDLVTIEPGFDVDAITLVGNVAGEPPFQGILKHRGWKAGKNEVPRLSDIRDSGIMTPAEVEIA